jgi:hypothetical protein
LEVDRLGATLDLLMASQENSLYKNPDYSNDVLGIRLEDIL